MHHALPFRKRNGIPVHLLAAFAVHGIKTQILRIRNSREESRLHGFGSALERGGNLRIPLRRVCLKSLGRCRFVGLPARLVQSQFDDRNVRVRRDQKVGKRRLRELQFHLVQRLEGVAKVDEDQIALVTKLREKARLSAATRTRAPAF